MENGDQRQFRLEVNPVVAGLVILELIFIIVMVTAFTKLFEYRPVELSMEVEGISAEDLALDVAGKEAIQHYIYQAVAESGASNNIQKTGVKIREGSLINTYYEDFDVHYVNFIADLPEVRQSYQVYYEWSEDGANEYISPNDAAGVICLDARDLVYGEFNCVATHEDMRSKLVARALSRHNYMLPGVNELSVEIEGSYEKGDIRFRLQYLECESQCGCLSASEVQAVIAQEAFRDFVRGLGFSPEDLEYYFDNCQ